jgi:hypothetical protein
MPHVAALVHFPLLKIKVEIKNGFFRVKVSLRLVAQSLRMALSVGPK